MSLTKQFIDLVYNDDKCKNYYFLMSFVKHKKFLMELFDSINKSIFHFNQCKDYYYTMKIPYTNLYKNYSKLYIISLFNCVPTLDNSIKEKVTYDIYDKIFLYYVYNKNFYIKLFNAFDKAIINHHQVKDFTYVFIIPELFNKKYNCDKLILEAKDMINLYNISHMMNLPLPNPNDFIN